jgi:hypothetical protein
MNRRKQKKLWKRVDENLFRNDMYISLSGISRYEAKLHMLVLFGNYNYTDIVEALGALWIDIEFKSDIRNPGYRKKAIRQEKDFFLNVFYSPKENYFPWCTIEVHSSKDLPIQTYKNFLKELNKKLPDIKVSAVEYAIDVFCNDYEAVKNLQWLIRRCLYLPYEDKIITFDNDETTIKEYDVKISYLSEKDKEKVYKEGHNIIEMNEVFRIGNNHKVYERGPDEKKKGLGWEAINLDRVRMEHTAKRKLLTEKGIDALSDLIDNAHFMDINKNRWKFRKFERSAILPKLWKPYLEQELPYLKKDKKKIDFQGFTGSFQLEHIRGADKVDNVAQHTKQIKEMIPFAVQLNEAILFFDKKWREDTAILKG